MPKLLPDMQSSLAYIFHKILKKSRLMLIIPDVQITLPAKSGLREIPKTGSY